MILRKKIAPSQMLAQSGFSKEWHLQSAATLKWR
jgi:hypothetical protein